MTLTKTTAVYAQHAGIDLECDIYADGKRADDAPTLVFMYFHAGGLVGWSKECIPPWLVQTCFQRNWTLMSFAHRLLPHASGKELLEDAMAAWAFARRYQKRPESRVIAGGSSAGFFMATLIAQHVPFRDRPGLLALLSIQGIGTFRHHFFHSSVRIDGDDGVLPLPNEEIVELMAGPVEVGTTLPHTGKHTSEKVVFHLGKLREDGSKNGENYEVGLLPDRGADQPRREGLYAHFTRTNAWADLVGDVDRGFEWATDANPETMQRLLCFPRTIAFHGDADEDVPLAVSEHMRDGLGRDKVELFVAPGQTHLFEAGKFLEDVGDDMDVVRRAMARLDAVAAGGPS